MSRTDVHRPWNIQVADPTNRHLFYRYSEWEGQPLYWSPRNLMCGCKICTGQHWRRRHRRGERHHWNTHLRNARNTAPADREDIDIPPRAPKW